MNIKDEAITCYVLHLMMWDELAKTGGKFKTETDARIYHHAMACEFCSFGRDMSCSDCPSRAKGYGRSVLHCLGGLYYKWRWETDIGKRKKLAATIRDIELSDEFKELIA